MSPSCSTWSRLTAWPSWTPVPHTRAVLSCSRISPWTAAANCSTVLPALSVKGEPVSAFFPGGLGAVDVVQTVEPVAGLGNTVQAGDLDRHGTRGRLDLSTVAVSHHFDTAVRIAGQDDISLGEFPFFEQHGRQRSLLR